MQECMDARSFNSAFSHSHGVGNVGIQVISSLAVILFECVTGYALRCVTLRVVLKDTDSIQKRGCQVPQNSPSSTTSSRVDGHLDRRDFYVPAFFR
jgi:hypothetical protein